MLKHWTIARQMAVGMGGLCVAILLIAGIANLATATLSGVFREYRAAANGSSAAVAVMQNLYQARLASLKARIDGGGGYADQVRASIDAVRAAEPELARLIVGTGGEAARMAVLADNLARYEFAFNTALQRQSQRDLLVGQLNEYAAEVETSLNKIITIMSVRGDRRSASASIKAMRAYLEGRAGFGRYLVSNDDADLKDTLTSFQKARAALVIMDREDAAESSERLNGMAGLLEEAALAIRARNQSYATMDAIGPMIIEDMRAMQGALVAKQGRLGPEGETLVRRFEAIMLAAALSLSLTGAMLAWWLSRRVSRRLKRSVASLTALADGDMDAKIVGQDRRTELGSMARAMVRFRDNLKETRRLEREALEKERRDRAEDAARAAAAEEKQARKARERAEEEERRRRETARRETEERRAAEARELAAQQRQEAARRRVIEELRDAVGAVVDAAVAGDFSRRIDAGFEDETLARLAGRINELIASVERGVSAAGGVVSGIAKGDLRHGMQGEFAGAFAGLQADVGETIRGLTDMIADIAESGETVHGGATEITARADDLAKRTESAAASIEQTAAAVGEISESLGQVSVNVAEATVVANEARRRAEEGGDIVRTAVSAMDAVAGSSRRIASIIDVIEDISFQINLLALNAGVEAARAGDAGRGFSVVAAEVRALALRTSDAVHDVTGLINESVANVDRGARSVDEASSALTGIAGGVVDIAERMAAIASAVEEQSSGVGEINQAISGLDRSTQDNAAMFEEVSAACHTLTASAESLRASIGRFTVAKTRARAA